MVDQVSWYTSDLSSAWCTFNFKQTFPLHELVSMTGTSSESFCQVEGFHFEVETILLLLLEQKIKLTICLCLNLLLIFKEYTRLFASTI